jgi:hypothetical protein
MKTVTFGCLIFILLNLTAFAQLDALWTNTFGGPYADGGRSVFETSDGGFIIAGYTYSYGAGSADLLLIKTDLNGAEQWTRTFGGSGWEYGNSVIQTSDGGYLVVGYTSSLGAGSKDVYLVKTDSLGVEDWTNTFGGASVDVGMSVIESANGGYVICGYTESCGYGESDVYLIRTNNDGDEIWSYTYGGTSSDVGTSIMELDDGTLVLVGSTGSFGSANRDAYMVITDSLGGQLENFAYLAGTNNYEDA